MTKMSQKKRIKFELLYIGAGIERFQKIHCQISRHPIAYMTAAEISIIFLIWDVLIQTSLKTRNI